MAHLKKIYLRLCPQMKATAVEEEVFLEVRSQSEGAQVEVKVAEVREIAALQYAPATPR